jgi:death-on-curing family protein
MARHRETVGSLAKEASLDIDDVLIALLDVGVECGDETAVIPRGSLARLRARLGLSSSPPGAGRRAIADLARRAGMSEREARKKLMNAELIAKMRLKKVPRGLLRDAERELGLRGTTLHPPMQPLTQERALPRKYTKAWPLVGPEQHLLYLTAEDVERVHWTLVDDFKSSKDPIDPPGVRSEALLDSAAFRPRTSIGDTDKYPSVAMAGASLMYGIVHDHPFHNGNKRTAIVSLLVFVDRNGWILTVDQDEIYDFLVTLADHKLKDRSGEVITNSDAEVLHIANWLQRNSRRIGHREHPLQFRRLRGLLESYGCRLSILPGNKIDISRGKLRTQIGGYRNDGEDVSKQTIHKIRKDLELDENNGYDSDIFYDAGPRIPEFIHKYRKLLIRLAKV